MSLLYWDCLHYIQENSELVEVANAEIVYPVIIPATNEINCSGARYKNSRDPRTDGFSRLKWSVFNQSVVLWPHSQLSQMRRVWGYLETISNRNNETSPMVWPIRLYFFYSISFLLVKCTWYYGKSIVFHDIYYHFKPETPAGGWTEWVLNYKTSIIWGQQYNWTLSIFPINCFNLHQTVLAINIQSLFWDLPYQYFHLWPGEWFKKPGGKFNQYHLIHTNPP